MIVLLLCRFNNNLIKANQLPTQLLPLTTSKSITDVAADSSAVKKPMSTIPSQHMSTSIPSQQMSTTIPTQLMSTSIQTQLMSTSKPLNCQSLRSAVHAVAGRIPQQGTVQALEYLLQCLFAAVTTA